MCHNRRVTVEMTAGKQGCQRWTAAMRRPALRAQRFGLRNGSAAFGYPARIIGRTSDHDEKWRKSSTRFGMGSPRNAGQDEVKLAWANLTQLHLIALNLT
jgi:hypothetical protein